MKTIFKRASKSTLAVVLTLCLLFSCMTVGIMSTSAASVDYVDDWTQQAQKDVAAGAQAVYDASVGASAGESVGATWSFSGGKVYFDNTRTNWSDSDIQLCIGKDGYTSTYTMTAVTNSNGALYYADLPSSGWGDATYMAVIGNSSSWGSGSWGSSNLSNANHRTGTYTSGLTSNSSGKYYLIPSAAANGSSLTLSSTYQYNQKAYAYYSNDGSSYSSGDTGGTTSIKAAYFNSATSWTYTTDTTSPTAAWNNAVYSCTATFTATAKTGYEFVGWFSSTTATSATSTNTTYTTVVRQANNLYARFKKAATNYTGITAVAKGTTDGTSYSVDLGTIKSSTTVSSATGLSVSAPAKTGYTFSKWIASGSGTFDNANNASTTFHPAASSEIATAQYKKSYNVTKNTPSNGTITLEKTSVVAGETFKVTLAPSSGYRVATFTVGGADKKSSLNSSNEYTHTATGTGNSIAVNATFEAIPGTTIYIKKTLNTTDGYTNIHLWDGSSTTNISTAGSWPGDAFTTSPWTTTTDGKYYYRTYTWNVSTFKFILNNGGDSQKTNDSAAYATGKSYYINSATAGQAAVLTEGVPQAYAITYTSTYASSSDVTWGGTKPATAYPGESVSFTVSAKTGYKVTGVKYNDGTDHTLTASSGTYTFTMPASAVTVTATTVKTYTVTLTAGTGFDTKKYKVGSGNQQTYSSAITVDSGANVVFDVTYTTGYEYDSANSILNGATASNSNKTFTLSSITANKTVTLKAKKITWSGLTAVGKYTENGTDYTGTFATNPVSIAATSATQLDGTTVTAPATVTVSGVKYNFVDFVATSGSVTTAATSGTNKTTTFKPTAANAVCTARYKKVYNITSSVDNTGTGAGTVSTNVTEVVAGGSYTITATAKSGSAVESVKVNGTAKTATASQTISSVSANQAVVAKFKSNVYLKGTMNSTAWAGDVMQANSAGTTYTITDVVMNAGTTYQFRHWVDSGGDGTWSSTVDNNGWNLSTFANHGTSGDNLTITPTVKVKVTFVSDGTKFTSITAVPYNSTQYNVTLTQSADYTITATYMSVEYTTSGKNANVTVPVYSGTEFSYTVTPASGKYLSAVAQSNSVALSPAFVVTTHASSYTGTISSVSKAFAVSATVANKLKVTCTTNKTEWGTVSTSPEYARPGETVTITYTAASGTLKTLTVYDTTNSTTIKSWSRDANGDMKLNQTNQGNVSLVFGKLRELVKVKAGESVGADDELTFTMPEGNVSITATYEEYVGTSEYYYNYYSTSGKGNSVQLSEGSINGSAYGYYNVTDRTENDQLFTVSHRTEVTGTRYVYFTCPGSWNNLHVYFFDGVNWNWPGDTMSSATETGNSNYKYAIPSGAKKVIFNNGNNSYQTQNIDLTSTNGAYYVSSNEQTTSASVGQWQSAPDDAGINGFTETEYFSDQNDSDIYPASYQAYTDAGLFNDHGIGNTRVAKPKGDSFGDNKTDYYILVFYPGVTYTIGDKTFTPSGNPLVYWSPTKPGQTAETASYVKVYAKDGAIRRDGDLPERNNRTYSTFEHHANTFVYSDSGYANHIGTRSSHDGQSSEGTGYDGYTYDYIQKFEKGETLYIKTNLKDDTYMNRYYLYAYSINGKCYQIHTVAESQTGSVTEAFTVPEDWEYDYVEITPIYFLRDSSNAITFYVEGYDEEVMHAGWGNTPFVYPFYQDANFNYVTNVNNPFGGYPGQPMVFYKGNYYTQLPRTFEAIPESGGTATNCTIKGVTLGNGYWDDIHVLTKEVTSHFQTYDYDDLYKIYKEYPDHADHIICSFKYRTKKNNDEPSSLTSSTIANYNKTNGNGWEVLTDYYGRPVDIFGNLLKDAALTTAQNMITNKTADSATTGVVHAISQDYKSNSAGDYATEWAIYDTTGAKVTGGNKTTIVPSALAITETGHFQNYDSATRAFQGIYDALQAKTTTVVGQPVVVTYEKSIYGGGDKADRCDARWYYSKTGEPISATTRIEYTDDGKNWVTDTYNENTGTGSHTGTQAYFTGKASTAKDESDSGSAITGKNTTYIEGTTGGGYYTFKAENHNGTNGNYEFVGWYLLRDNYQNISVRSSYGADATTFASHAEQSKTGDIFVARFKKTATGTLDIFHEVHPQTSGYGHVYVEAIVKDAGGTQQGAKIGSISGGTLTDHIQIPSTYIRSGEGYTVEATFKAVAYPTSHFDDFYATIGELLETYDGYAFIKSKTIDKDNGTATITYDVDKLFSVQSGSPVQTVTSITHYSKFSLRTDLTYNLEYRFTTRYYGDKLYKYTNKEFTAEELRSYFRSQIENDQVNSITIDAQFVQRKAPFESNYREDLTWVIDNVQITNNVGKLTATQVPIKWAKATVYDFDNDGDLTTTTMEAPLEKLFDKTVKSKPADAESAITNWDTTCTDDDLYTTIRTSYNNGNTTVPLYLHHWEVYQLDSFTYKTNSDGSPKMKEDGFNLDIDTGKSKLVCLTYSTKFNYIGYEDYAIVPVYTTDLMSTPERQAISNSRTDSSATLLTITRNHWNTTVSGTADSGKYGAANTNYDRIYVDFMLNYNYKHNNQNILLNSTGENIKVGFIVRSYTIDYSSGTGVKDYTGRSSKVYVFTNEEKATIDNKNRIEYCYGFANSQNNSQYGLNFEFVPFIVDTNDQTNNEAPEVTIDNVTYKTLYDDSTVSILDGVNFYMIGKSDTTWDN